MVPQIVLLHKTRGTQPFVCVYIAGMGMYRLLYICNWIFRHLSLRASSHFSTLRFTCATNCGCAVESTGKALVRVARFRQSNGSCGPPAAHSLGCWCCRSRMSSSCKCVGLNPTKQARVRLHRIVRPLALSDLDTLERVDSPGQRCGLRLVTSASPVRLAVRYGPGASCELHRWTTPCSALPPTSRWSWSIRFTTCKFPAAVWRGTSPNSKVLMIFKSSAPASTSPSPRQSCIHSFCVTELTCSSGN